MKTTRKKVLRRAHKTQKKASVQAASKKFTEEYGDVALALEIMRNAKVARPQLRARSGRLTYRSL